MANDRQHLLEVCRCCRRILDESADKENLYQLLKTDLTYQESVLFNLIQIGENVNRLSDELKDENDIVPWHQIVGMRNVITHGYGTIEIESIAETVQQDVPALLKACEYLLNYL